LLLFFPICMYYMLIYYLRSKDWRVI
jgi:hypothetical protein